MRETWAATVTSRSVAAATVTAAPTGRSSSMWASTASTISSEGARSLLSTSVTPTVPGPPGSSTTLAFPTPGISMAHCRY